MPLLIASSNLNKVKEYRQLLWPWRLEMVFHGSVPQETGATFKQNAIIKARFYGQKYNLPVLADDSGLEIKALRGFPGVRSARFAKGNFETARQVLLKRLAGMPRRTARFVCVIALYRPAKPITTFTGVVSGQIAVRELGQRGFGYDPIFYLPRLKKTFGQLTRKEKALYSHRARAAKKLIAFLQKSM